MKTILTPPSNPTQRSTTVTTNLYELIEAVQNEVGPRTTNSSLPQSCISCVPDALPSSITWKQAIATDQRHKAPCAVTSVASTQLPGDRLYPAATYQKRRENAGSPGDGSRCRKNLSYLPIRPVYRHGLLTAPKCPS